MTIARPRLWVVSDIYYPEDVSTGHVMTCIAEGLAPNADVKVLCGLPSYSKSGERPPRHERRHGTEIRRVGLFAFPKDRLPLRALNVLSFTVSALFHLLLALKAGDRILCVTNPPTLAPLLARIARWKDASFVLLVHDVFPETAVAAGKLSATGMMFRLLSALALPAYTLADAVVVLGRDMAKLAATKRGTDDGIVIIENWADLDEIHPIPRDRNGILADLGWKDDLVLQFSGNLGRTHGVETLIDTAERLRDRTDLRWLFAGFGGKQELAQAAAQHNPSVVFLPRQPREKLAELLGAADAHLVAFVPGMAGLSVPSRMYNIMAAGKPIIAVADADSELALTVVEEGIGWHVLPGDPEALTNLLRSEVTAESCSAYGAAARRLAEARYGFKTQLEAFRKLFRLPETPTARI